MEEPGDVEQRRPPTLRVLVVDDDPNVRFTVRVALEGSPPPDGKPMQVVEVGDGEAALTALEERPFDVVVLDIMMPGMDGFATLQSIRRRSTHPDVAVVMLTARGRESDHLNAFKAGADTYITKPFDVDELAAAVREVATADPEVRRARRQQELGRAELLLQLEHGFDD